MSYKELFAELGQPSMYPKVFAGKYPTRIALRNTDVTLPFEYFGKPSPEAFAQLKRQVILKTNNYARVVVQEYDQNGVVYSAMGGGGKPCPFYDSIYAVPRMLWEMDRTTKLYVTLHRKLIRVNKRNLWVVPALWDAKYEPYVAMVQQVSKLKLRFEFFTDPQNDYIVRTVSDAADKWFARPEVQPVIIPALPRPPQPRQAAPRVRFHRNPIGNTARVQTREQEQEAALAALQQMNRMQPHLWAVDTRLAPPTQQAPPQPAEVLRTIWDGLTTFEQQRLTEIDRTLRLEEDLAAE